MTLKTRDELVDRMKQIERELDVFQLALKAAKNSLKYQARRKDIAAHEAELKEIKFQLYGEAGC